MTIQNSNDQKINKLSDIQLTILNNDKIEDKLTVIIVHFNPMKFKRIKELALQFKNETLLMDDVDLFIAELSYDNKFEITEKHNDRHIQLSTTNDNITWPKENLINIAVSHLYKIKPNFKCFAWIDSDLEFDTISWPIDTLKLLNGKYDIIQLFSHCNDLNKENETMNTYHSFCYNYYHKKNYTLQNNIPVIIHLLDLHGL